MLKHVIWYNFGLWPNCNNNCKFCLRKNREVWSKERLLHEIDRVRQNIDFIDWKDKFADGISILGGEIYFITDPDIQDAYMLLVDDIIDKILFVSFLKDPFPLMLSCSFSGPSKESCNHKFLDRYFFNNSAVSVENDPLEVNTTLSHFFNEYSIKEKIS